MALHRFCLMLAMLVGLAAGSQLRATSKTHAQSKMAMKAHAKLPWANLDADGGMEYEEGNKREDESDPKLFSMSQYEHTSATDDADVAEDEPFQDDEMNHGDDSLEQDD